MRLFVALLYTAGATFNWWAYMRYPTRAFLIGGVLISLACALGWWSVFREARRADREENPPRGAKT